MKKLLIMMLLSSIIQQSSAQQENNYPFDIPPNSTNRLFWVELGNGNRMEVYVNNTADLDKLKNMDSLIYGFLKDLNAFRDSLQDQLTVKRIDYNVDDAENRKVRITQYRQNAETFLIKDGNVSALKTLQDTVNFIGKTNFVADYPLRKKFDDVRYFKVKFLLNNVSDLAAYMNGVLNNKIESMRLNADKKWDNNGDRIFSPRADSSIKGRSVKGYIAGGDFLVLRASAEIQNYRSSFVPSISYGAAIVLGSRNFKREIGIQVENHFNFSRNSAGNLKANLSYFLSLSYSRGPIKDNDIMKQNSFMFNIHAAYLIRQKNNFYEKNTLRLGMGELSLFEGKTKIQPVMYFSGIKLSSPGIRWVQSF